MTLLRFHQTETIRCWLKHGVLIAVSGGADSTALLHCLAGTLQEQSQEPSRISVSVGKLAVAHVNHALRGDESDADAAFVRKCSEQYELPYFEYRIQPAEWSSAHNKRSAGSLEDMARTIRYRFLTQTAERQGFRYIATAHTADDQTETVLHRIFRGTGLAGLSGIQPFRQLSEAVTLIRPMLKNTRKEILDYLQSQKVSFREDSSNVKNAFTRNRIRNHLLPLIRQECNPQADIAVQRLAQLAEANETVLNELLQNFDEQIVVQKREDVWILDPFALRRWSVPTQREWFIRFWKRNGLPLREMGLKQWETFMSFLSDDCRRLELPGNVLVYKEEQYIHLQIT